MVGNLLQIQLPVLKAQKDTGWMPTAVPLLVEAGLTGGVFYVLFFFHGWPWF